MVGRQRYVQTRRDTSLRVAHAHDHGRRARELDVSARGGGAGSHPRQGALRRDRDARRADRSRRESAGAGRGDRARLPARARDPGDAERRARHAEPTLVGCRDRHGRAGADPDGGEEPRLADAARAREPWRRPAAGAHAARVLRRERGRGGALGAQGRHRSEAGRRAHGHGHADAARASRRADGGRVGDPRGARGGDGAGRGRGGARRHGEARAPDERRAGRGVDGGAARELRDALRRELPFGGPFLQPGGGRGEDRRDGGAARRALRFQRDRGRTERSERFSGGDGDRGGRAGRRDRRRHLSDLGHAPRGCLLRGPADRRAPPTQPAVELHQARARRGGELSEPELLLRQRSRLPHRHRLHRRRRDRARDALGRRARPAGDLRAARGRDRRLPRAGGRRPRPASRRARALAAGRAGLRADALAHRP